MPTPADWQAAIANAGFPVQLDYDFDVDTFTGFLPCRVNGELSGFEYYSSKISVSEASELEVPAPLDFSVTFQTVSRPMELVAAAAASGALAAATDGLLIDPQSDEQYSGKSAIEWAEKQIAEI